MTCSAMISRSADAAPGGRLSGLITVGVLSDTHGELHRRVAQALAGVDHIIHAGDVGAAQVLVELRRLAPVTAVRGNCDLDAWAEALPLRAELEVGGVRILAGHVAAGLRDRLETAAGDGGDGFAVVISGHTHLAAVERRDGTLHLNPGSAGPRRFGRPRTIARLTIRPPVADEPRGAPHVDVAIVTVGS